VQKTNPHSLQHVTIVDNIMAKNAIMPHDQTDPRIKVRHGRYAVLLQRQCILFSRQRHGSGMKQLRLHHHATAIVCRVVRVNKKTMPDKTPGTGFLIATHHPECRQIAETKSHSNHTTLLSACWP
jgi:hypothetical protein